MEEKEALQRIKELETELVKLRLQTRHIDFSKDYDRRQYLKDSFLTADEIEKALLQYLDKIIVPIKMSELIEKLIHELPNLGERDFEKTGSGNIRIYSMIRSTIERMTRSKIITKPEHGKLILTEKWDKLEQIKRKAKLALNKLMDNRL